MKTHAHMFLASILMVALWAASTSTQTRPILVVQPFTAAAGVELPYDMQQLQGQLAAELRVMLSKQFEVVAEAPASSQAPVYTIAGEITSWRAGNVAKRMLVGFGSGREATDLRYQMKTASGEEILNQSDTIRTNFYSQAGSTGTLARPIAQKLADRIKKARLN